GGMVEVKPQMPTHPGAFDAMHDDESMRHLTSEEKQARLRALKTAEEEMKKATERGEPVREEPRAKKAAPAAEPEVPAAPVEADNNNRKPSAAPVGKRAHHPVEDEGERVEKGKGGKLKLRGGEERRQSGKITVHQALSNIEENRMRSLASIRRARE